ARARASSLVLAGRLAGAAGLATAESAPAIKAARAARSAPPRNRVRAKPGMGRTSVSSNGVTHARGGPLTTQPAVWRTVGARVFNPKGRAKYRGGATSQGGAVGQSSETYQRPSRQLVRRTLAGGAACLAR